MSQISIQTRNQAYLEVLGSLPEKRRIVYQTIRLLGRATNKQIAEFLNWPINCVTGRVTELAKMFLVKSESKDDQTLTGYEHAIWQPVESVEEWEALMNRFIEQASQKVRLMEADLSQELSRESKSILEKEISRIKSRIKKTQAVCESLAKS